MRFTRMMGALNALTCATLLAMWSAIPPAKGAAPVTEAVGPSCQAGGLKIASGPPNKGYANLYRNIEAMCGATMPLCEVRTSGGLENLDVLSNKRADVGLAQVDTVRDMGPGNPNIAALQAVMPLNWNYLHIVASSTGYSYEGAKRWGILPGAKQVFVIRKFSDLKGKRVALVGSAKLLGRTLVQRHFKDYNLQFVDVDTDKEAFAMVRENSVQAMFTVSGAPHGAVGDLSAKSGLTLVPFDEAAPAQYQLRKLNYANVAVYNLRALAVQNVLLTRPFGEAKAAVVGRLRQCIVEHLQELKDGEFEPAWNEMDFDRPIPDLQKFVAPAASARR